MAELPVPLSPEYDLQRAVQELVVPAYVIGRDGRFRWLNPAAIALIGDRRGQSFESVVAPEHLKLARTNFARKIVGEDGTVFELIVADTSGDPVRLRICSAPLRRHGSVTGVFGIGVPLGRASFAAGDPQQLELTPRQLETLQLLGEGLETKGIAERLGVAEETARNHIRAVLRVLEVHSRLEAVVAGLRLGLLRPRESAMPPPESPRDDS
jgi:DNA-binding CsgD family transcriptional regulator